MKIEIRHPELRNNFQVDVALYNRGNCLGIDFDNLKGQILFHGVSPANARQMIRELQAFIGSPDPSNESPVVAPPQVVITPSIFTVRPFNSTFQKMEVEIVARNIMVILARTGNKFRSLTFEEYIEEREKDKEFTAGEKYYFEQVSYLAEGDKGSILSFAPCWRNAYIEKLEEQLTQSISWSSASVEEKSKN